jgi:predicted N-acyltransferase
LIASSDESLTEYLRAADNKRRKQIKKSARNANLSFKGIGSTCQKGGRNRETIWEAYH